MALSPMMVHYQQVKSKYPDCIVFYRLGDFYEMFFDDAIKASKILDLTLTGRNCGLEERAPMCGVPFHAAENYISKLISAGEKVAICEQITTPSGGKELVERGVVKVVTAGTVGDEYLDDRNNNFIASVYLTKNGAGLSWADITTGEFFTEYVDGENFRSDLSDKLVKIYPSEIISNIEGAEFYNNSSLVSQGVLPKFSYVPESYYEHNSALSVLKNQLKIQTLSPFLIDENEISVNSAGALISYLRDTQKHALINISGIKHLSSNQSLMLDMNTVRNLELVKTIRDGKRHGSLLWLLDKTHTSMGARKLQNYILSPLVNAEKINYRLDGVANLYDNTLVRQGLIEVLSGFRDIARISGKISNNNVLPIDCLNLITSLKRLPEIKFMLSGFTSEALQNINAQITDFSDLCKLLDRAITNKNDIGKLDGDYIKYGYNNELDQLREVSINSKDILAKLENDEREKTGIKNLKVGYNRVFGYYFEVTNSFKDKVPYYFQRKQTLTGAERYITPELNEIEANILNSEEKSVNLETKLYNEIKGILCGYVDDLKLTAEAIAELDVLLAFAIVAREKGYVRPNIIDKENVLSIVDGRHPVVEATSKARFVPNDCLLDTMENRMAIITGPNMAGKSTYMRQVAIIVLMAHIGAFVPAKSADIPIIDRIFTRIGASDSLISNQSTFMVEMSETAYILKNATEKSLIILDEIGRGTSTFDGLSIAWAVVEHITEKIKAKTLFATHYHELSELEGKIFGVKNFKITIKEMQGTLVFLRKIMRGSANKSFGIEVAELAGIEKGVTARAKKILKSLERADITRSADVEFEVEEQQIEQISQTERLIKDLNMNNLTPMQAFAILSDLNEKLNEK